MATDKQTKIAYEIALNYENVNIEYIEALSKQVDDIQKGDIDLMQIHEQQRENLNRIRIAMQKAERKSARKVDALILLVALQVYKSKKKYYKAKDIVQLPFKKNRTVVNAVAEVRRMTNVNLHNISKTTVMDVNYRKCIDKAIQSVQSGSATYEEAIRKAKRQAVKNGNKVEYASGRKRRLDTAVRMNVLDGIRQMEMEMDRITGEEFGADGVEIDAHSLCAKDHIGIQGQQMTHKEYERRVVNVKGIRNIGTCNCQHRTKSIIMAISKPAYTKEQLEQMKKYTEEPLDALGGKNRRDASNQMRVLETRVRECKEQLIMFKNDPKEKARYERRLDRTMAKYKDLTKKSGLKPQYDRMKIE